MSGKNCVVPLAILIIIGLFASDIVQVSAQQECGINVSNIETQCLKFVGKSGPEVPPSQGCCAALNAVDLKCACKYLTNDLLRKLADKISEEKVVFVAKSCGVKLPPGGKCASK